MAVRRAAKKRKAAKKTANSPRKALAANHKAQLAAYRKLQKQVDQAWTKMKSHVKKKASTQVLMRDKAHLMLLLGECNYMAKECKRCAARAKKRA